MSVIEEKLCEKLLNEYFGKNVAEVSKVLMKKGCHTLKHIYSVCQSPKCKVQESLCVLIKHNLVTWNETKIDNTEYILHNNRVLLLLRYPRYVYLIRDQFGEEAEMVIDLLLKEGQATASQIIIDSALKLLDAAGETNSQPEMRDNKHISFRKALEELAKNQYIQRCPNPKLHNQAVPILTIKGEDLYRFDSNCLDLKLLQEEIRDRRFNPDHNLMIQATKTVQCHPDKDIYWRLNYDRFHLEFRDIEMKNCVIRRIDATAGACFASILNTVYRKNDPWSPVYNTVLLAEIRDQQKDFPHLEQYLKVMAECGGRFLRRTGDAGGGEYVLDVASFIRTITMSHIDNIVKERYGSDAARIFRLVRENGMMLQNHVAKLSMVCGKEASPLVYKLLKDNFLRMFEVRKGTTPTPASKISYLVYMEPNSVVRMVLKLAYKSIYNLMEQRNMKHLENKRLLERKSRVEMIVDSLKQSGGSAEQIREVEEMFSPSEREHVDKVIEVEDRLLDYITGVDETIFLIQMYMYYESPKTEIMMKEA